MHAPAPAKRALHAVTRARSALVLTAAAGAVGAAALAGCGGDDDDLPAVEGATSPRMEVHATEMSFDPDAIAVGAGDVEVVLQNDGSILHDLHIDDQPFIVEANAGESATGNLTLEAGRYEFFCGLPGHREAGMEGVLEVR